MLEIVDGTCKGCKVENPIHWTLNIERLTDIVLDKLELRMREEVLDVLNVSGNQVVNCDN
jgi:hypothetical protein